MTASAWEQTMLSSRAGMGSIIAVIAPMIVPLVNSEIRVMQTAVMTLNPAEPGRLRNPVNMAICSPTATLTQAVRLISLTALLCVFLKMGI